MGGEAREAHRVCDAAVARAFGVLGKRWNGMIVGVLVGGPASFSQLRRAVAGISDSVLADRLVELTALALVERTVDHGPPVAVRYALTEAGTGLVPILEQLGRWAAENLGAAAG